MEIKLDHTTAPDIAKALVQARIAAGSPAMDMVLTLVVVTDEDTVSESLRAAIEVAGEHPARVLGLILGDGRGQPRLDATVRVGENASGESLLLRLSGPLTRHAESVALPLLLPDSPVVVWWPTPPPTEPGTDPIGSLARRRLTDVGAAGTPVRALQSLRYAPGDTDLAWTRATPWRALLAAALDQVPTRVTGGQVTAHAGDPVGALLIAWLESRLGVPIERIPTSSTRVVSVVLHSTAGEIRIDRGDLDGGGAHSSAAGVGTFSVPGAAPQHVPLADRSLPELLAEELRRLDADEVYAETLAHLQEQV